MYYDDSYDPNLPNDIECEDIPEIANQTLVYDEEPVYKKNKRNNEKRRKQFEVKTIQDGHCCIQSKTKTPTGTNVYIEYYYSKITPGSLIRNAITGGYEYGHRIGSADEDLFFKVVRAVGDCGNSDSHTLYYHITYSVS
jgi:hypothetical protein